MLEAREVLFRHIADIVPVATSHGVGEKRVIATSLDVGNLVTQIACTRLKAGDKVETHVHPTMDEHFFFVKGECKVTVEGSSHVCSEGDYLFIPTAHSHSIEVVKESLMITIGLAICSKNTLD